MITATKDEKYLQYIAACLLIFFLFSLTGCTSTGSHWARSSVPSQRRTRTHRLDSGSRAARNT